MTTPPNADNAPDEPSSAGRPPDFRASAPSEPPSAPESPGGPEPGPGAPSPASAWTPPGGSAPDAPVPGEAPPRQWPGRDVPAYAYRPPPTQIAPRTSRLAIASLVTGLLGLVLLGVGLGIAALVQAGRRGERGKGLAVGGLVASAVWTIVAVITLATVVGSLFTADRDASGRVTGEDKVLPAGLRAGDCFTGFEEGAFATPVTALPCTRPHDGEAIAELRMSGAEYPGDRKVAELAADMCDRKMAQFRRSRYAADLESYTVPPTKTSWSTGDRKLICLARYTGPGTLTSPLARTVDPNLKEWLGLARGDCLGKWDDSTAVQRVVPCTEPHWLQVYAVYSLKAGPYPGAKATERKAEAGCDKHAEKVFTESRYPDLVSWVFPQQDDWEAGVRTVVCFAESDGRPMRKSILPR